MQKSKLVPSPHLRMVTTSGLLPLVWGISPFASSQQTIESHICYIQPQAKGDRKIPHIGGSRPLHVTTNMCGVGIRLFGTKYQL